MFLGSVYDDDYKLVDGAKPYTTDSGEMKKNHPLMMMVSKWCFFYNVYTTSQAKGPHSTQLY